MKNQYSRVWNGGRGLKMDSERRKLERFSLEIPAELITGDEREYQKRIETRTRDLSANGAFVYLGRAPNVGTRVRLEMQAVIGSLPLLVNMPETVRITVEGRVVRQNAEGVGIAFDVQLRFDQPG